MDIHEHYQKMCAGYVTSWISRPKQPLTTVAKSIETISLKKGISRAEFTNAVQEIRRLSVDTFGPERLARFNQITGELRKRGVL